MANLFFLTMLRQHSQYDSRLGFSFRVLVLVRVRVRVRLGLGLGIGLELVLGSSLSRVTTRLPPNTGRRI